MAADETTELHVTSTIKKKKTTSRSLKRKKVFTKEKSSIRIGLVGNINMVLARLPTSLDLVSFRVK